MENCYNIIKYYDVDSIKSILYKSNIFLLGYDSNRKTYKSINNAKKHIEKLAKNYNWSSLTNYFAVEDNNTNELVAIYDLKNKMWIK